MGISTGGGLGPPTFDATVPHSARVWNYWLGGKDHLPADREFGNQVAEGFPGVRAAVEQSREFHHRLVLFLAGEVGVRQFLDVGVGLPGATGTHEAAQGVDPSCRVVYVDNDPLVMANARALLTSTPEGATACVEADVRDPAEILREAAGTLDFTRPIALLLLGVMGEVGDPSAYTVVDRLKAALPAGSYVAVSDGTAGACDPELAERLAEINGRGYGYRVRTPEGVGRFLSGLDLVDPGVVPAPLWRPDPAGGSAGGGERPAELPVTCGVGRKPGVWAGLPT